MKFTKVRNVTLPVLKLDDNVEKFVKILGPIHDGKKLDDSKEPAKICRAVDLETGEEGMIICSHIMVNELHANYEGDSYVGKSFSIVKESHPTPGKRYKLVRIVEVSIDPDESQKEVKGKK